MQNLFIEQKEAEYKSIRVRHDQLFCFLTHKQEASSFGPSAWLKVTGSFLGP